MLLALFATAPAAIGAGQWDGSQWDGSQWDGSQWDASRWDASRWDASRWDASQWDASQWDASQWDSFSGYDPLYKYQWNLRAINVPDAWRLFGPGSYARNICVVDSGVDHTHPDLKGAMWRDPATGAHGYDFVSNDADPMDVGGHGTHVASIAAAKAGDKTGIAGIVRAKIMAVRVLDADGNGTDDNLAKGIRYCADKGAHVISLSLSITDRSKLVGDAATYAVGKGALVVASAGNSGCTSCAPTSLTKVRGVLTVTAMAPDGTLAKFANNGPGVDLAAPGVAIPGAYPGGKWVLASGTSQAVPHVAGTAALMWQADPALSARQVYDLLLSTSVAMGATSSMQLKVVNAQGAVAAALAP